MDLLPLSLPRAGRKKTKNQSDLLGAKLIMLVAAIVAFITAFYLSHYFYGKKKPDLLTSVVCLMAFLSAIQSVRFLYLLAIPSLKTLPFLGQFLGNGMGWIDIPENLEGCLNSIGSNFDLALISIGPISIVYLSIKQVVETIAPASAQGSSNQASSESLNQN